MSTNVKAIPEGYTSVTPYLIFKDASKAIDYYKKVFAAKEIMRMPSPDGKIGHAEIQIGDSKLMLSDENEKNGSRSPEAFGGSPIAIHLYVQDVDQTVKAAVDAGGKLLKPIENMFYGDRNGMVQDPHGYKWCISTHVEDVTPEQMKQRMAELCG